jgi:hypothetical protein
MTAYKINCGTSQTNPKLLSNEVAMTETSATPRNSKRAADADAPRETIRTSTTLGFTRRRFCSVTAATVSVGLLDPRGFCRRDKAMTNGIAGIKQETGRNTSGIRSFSVNVPEAELAELRRRINSTRWPDRETVTDESQGVPLATIQELTRYWGADYDWRKCEAKLNALPQFITEIDGLDIHFIHVRSKHENALPLIVTHGWPGSVIEQAEDYRSTYQSYGTWRERIGRLPSGDSVATGVRVFGKAHHFRLGSRAHCKCLGRADEAPWIRTVCGARRRFGRGRLHCDGQTGASGVAGNSHQFPWDYSTRHREGAPVWRSPVIRPIRRRKTCLRAADQSIYKETCLRTNDGDSPANAVRIGGFARLPGSLAL